MKFFIFNFIIPIIFSYYVYDPYKVLEFINKFKLDEYHYKTLKKSFAITFQDAYTYNEISKNPPQPDFNINYHDKVDIEQLIENINITNISFYNFYREIKKCISELKDANLKIFIDENKNLKILSDLYLAFPIDFKIKKINNKNEIYCVFNNRYMQIFDNEILEQIKSNIDNYIISINGGNPFDFITNFGGKISSGKNPHGTFTRKFNTHNGQSLELYPLDFNDLNVEIVFNNGKRVNIKYFFISNEEILDLNNAMINQINLTEEDKKDITNNNLKEKIKWDEIDLFDIYKCRIDDKNKVNIFHVINLQLDDGFFRCIDLFDKNNYPIIFIFGKYEIKNMLRNNYIIEEKFIPYLLIELLSPLISVKYFTTRRVHELSSYKIPVYFGDNLISYHSEPFKIYLDKYDDYIIKKKYLLENKRKPTDILIYTDGTLLKISSVFLKIFQYYGAGIVTGFFGNPNENNIPFDSAQSSTFHKHFFDFLISSPRGYQQINEKYNITIKMPETEFLYPDKDIKNPLEYSVTPVDERVELFEYFNGNNYQNFIDEAKKIFEKYKTQCNPKNKKLVLVNDECYNIFENNYTHGGYICGDNGRWSKKCVPSYCDPGYRFNYTSNKCESQYYYIPDITKNTKIQTNERKSFNFLIIFIFLLFL